MDQSSPTRRGPGRPPKPAGAHLATREALIRCGLEVLTEKGYHAIGLDALLRQAGVPKGSFYHYFRSKDDFGLQVLDAYGAYFARKLDRRLLDTTLAPLARIAAFVEDAITGMARHGFKRGCLAGNLGQDAGALDEAFRERIEAVFRDWQTRLQRCLEAAVLGGELDRGADCASLAVYFWTGWEGAVLRAKLVRNAEPLALFARHYLAALPRPTS
jgi:TetR/AcrR family transcriptional repressor of nem operon